MPAALPEILLKHEPSDRDAAERAARGLDEEWHEGEQAQRCEQRPGDEASEQLDYLHGGEARERLEVARGCRGGRRRPPGRWTPRSTAAWSRRRAAPGRRTYAPPGAGWPRGRRAEPPRSHETAGRDRSTRHAAHTPAGPGPATTGTRRGRSRRSRLRGTGPPRPPPACPPVTLTGRPWQWPGGGRSAIPRHLRQRRHAQRCARGPPGASE